MQQCRLKHVKNCSWWWSHWKSIRHYTHRSFWWPERLKQHRLSGIVWKEELSQIWEKEKKEKKKVVWDIFKNQTAMNLYSKNTIRNYKPQAFLQWSCLQCLLYSLHSAFTSMVQEQAMYHVLLCLIAPALWNIRKLNERHY